MQPFSLPIKGELGKGLNFSQGRKPQQQSTDSAKPNSHLSGLQGKVGQTPAHAGSVAVCWMPGEKT